IITAAPDSLMTRRKVATERYGAESATTSESDREAGRPSATSSATRLRETRETAASAAARNPPSPVSRTARTTSRTRGPASTMASALAPTCEEREQQLALQVEHLPLLLRLGVVVAEQVQ